MILDLDSAASGSRNNDVTEVFFSCVVRRKRCGPGSLNRNYPGDLPLGFLDHWRIGEDNSLLSDLIEVASRHDRIPAYSQYLHCPTFNRISPVRFFISITPSARLAVAFSSDSSTTSV